MLTTRTKFFTKEFCEETVVEHIKKELFDVFTKNKKMFEIPFSNEDEYELFEYTLEDYHRDYYEDLFAEYNKYHFGKYDYCKMQIEVVALDQYYGRYFVKYQGDWYYSADLSLVYDNDCEGLRFSGVPLEDVRGILANYFFFIEKEEKHSCLNLCTPNKEHLLDIAHRELAGYLKNSWPYEKDYNEVFDSFIHDIKTKSHFLD